MLRVGLTGGLGSGKTTAAQRLAELGAHVLSADEIARELMQPGERVYAAIVERFGRGVVRGGGELAGGSGGELDRAALARLAFAEGRVEELNAIVHPATIAEQERRTRAIGEREPRALVVVESALLFETGYAGDGGWQRRFDRVVLVRAAEATKIARFVARAAGGRAVAEAQRRSLEDEARRRLAHLIDDAWKAKRCDWVIENDGTREELLRQVDAVAGELLEAARRG